MKRLFVLLLILLCAGCQVTPPPPPPVAPPPPPPELTWAEKLQLEVVTLPVALVTTSAGRVIIAYPQESLFSIGSVLPLAGGADALDPLAALLVAYPQARWDAKVQAGTKNGADYDLALAQKRSELLQRYLRQRRVAEGQILWQANAGDGIPLELTLRPLQPLVESSSGVKE